MTGLRASIRRAMEGARAQAEEEVNDEARWIRHRPETSVADTARKDAYSDWCGGPDFVFIYADRWICTGVTPLILYAKKVAGLK